MLFIRRSLTDVKDEKADVKKKTCWEERSGGRRRDEKKVLYGRRRENGVVKGKRR